MILKKLDISKGEMNILAIATGILIIGILAVISLMRPLASDGNDSLSLWGYSFSSDDEYVYAAEPMDDEPFKIEITEENQHDLYELRSTFNDAFITWQRVIRNALIFFYITVLYLIMRKKNGSQLQTSLRGFLLGSGLILLIFTVQLILDVDSLLVKFGHDFIHLVPLM